MLSICIILNGSSNASQLNYEEETCHAYLQRGGLGQVTKVVPTINILGESAMTLGAWQGVGDVGSVSEHRVDGYIAHRCRLSSRAIVKC